MIEQVQPEMETYLPLVATTAIIIPAYNEALAIGPTIAAYQKAFPGACIVVIDSNSDDETWSVARSHLRSEVDHLLREERQGKGFAVKRGLSRVLADIYVLTDGDLTYPAKDARALYDRILETRADMIVGDRRVGGTYEQQNTRFGHSQGNWLLTLVISLLAGKRYNDVLSGLRIMSAPFVECLDVRSEGFQLETEINIVAARLRCDTLELPVEYLARPEGSESKLSTVRDGIPILSFAIMNWIAFLPMHFFSLVAGLGWIVAGLLGYRVLSGFLETGWPYATTAIVGATFGIIGTLAFFTGLSLRILGRNERRREVASFLQRKRIWNAALDEAGL